MKILHTSDLHIGSPLTTHLSGERAALRRREISDTLRKMIDTAREYSAKAVIIAGEARRDPRGGGLVIVDI